MFALKPTRAVRPVHKSHVERGDIGYVLGNDVDGVTPEETQAGAVFDQSAVCDRRLSLPLRENKVPMAPIRALS